MPLAANGSGGNAPPKPRGGQHRGRRGGLTLRSLFESPLPPVRGMPTRVDFLLITPDRAWGSTGRRAHLRVCNNAENVGILLGIYNGSSVKLKFVQNSGFSE